MNDYDEFAADLYDAGWAIEDINDLWERHELGQSIGWIETKRLITIFIYGNDDGVAAWLDSLKERGITNLETIAEEARAECKSWFDCPFDRTPEVMEGIDWLMIADQIWFKIYPL